MRKQNWLAVSNNPQITALEQEFSAVVTVDGDSLAVLHKVRDLVHSGAYRLVSHPLAGSIKPNRNRYRSIIVSKSDCIDSRSVMLIGEACLMAEKLYKDSPPPKWRQQVDQQLQAIDLTLIESALASV